MKLLAYNILSGGFKDYQEDQAMPERLDKIVAAVRATEADFVSLVDTYRWQEKFRPEQLSEWFGYKNIYMIAMEEDRVRQEPHGMAVLTNLEVEKFETVRVYSRNIIKSRIKNKRGKVDIFSIYLDTYEEDVRLKQLEVLNKNINYNLPTILMGDFNAVDKNEVDPAKKTIVKLLAQFPQLKKIGYVDEMLRGEVTKKIKSWGLVDADSEGFFTFPSKILPLPIPNPLFRIDYAFVSPDIRVKLFEVLKGPLYDYTSDHYPIVADVEIQ